MTLAVARHKTALSRTRLSRPLGQALADGIVSPETSVFDYGCGRGDDLRHLSALGISVTGWDPTHRPRAEVRPADIVNLGYVVNVIEHRDERADVLRQAWALTERTLVIAARLTSEQKDLAGRPLADGIVTRSGTFQKFFDQTELAAWIHQVLEVPPVAAAPGIFYVFRDVRDAQQYLANRASSYQPRVLVDHHALYDAHQATLAPLLTFLTDHARPPQANELPESQVTAIVEQLGSLRRGHRLIRQVTGTEPWERAASARQADLLVYIGLSRFEHRPRLNQLPISLARDIKAHFGSYQEACGKADRLLYASGQTQLLTLVARKCPVGKVTPSALYVHRSALDLLPPVLRLYEGCARVLAGTVDVANVIKLSLTKPQVSYLAYPSFDRTAHPALQDSVIVNLNRLTVDFLDYDQSSNPPVLHRKEEFVADNYPHRDLWSALTRSEERAGLYEHPQLIGTRNGWEQVLRHAEVELRGHRLKCSK